MKNKPILVGLLFAIAVGLFLSTSALANIDNRIQSAAKNSYSFKTYLKDDDIKVKSKDGVVALTGTVSSDSHRSLAQETVAGLPGVKRVDNQLEVKGDQPKEGSDAWLTSKVKTALIFHRHVSALNTNVDVKDGIVTLKGEAHSQAQKDLTAKYAKDVEGVKDVKNEIVVTAKKESTLDRVGDAIDDASVTAQVKMALLTHRSTSALNTNVDTNNGVVNVSGKAKNPAEKQLVTELVENIKGVKSVKNNMAVE
jgi:osmotically-inducible protein OsmY